MWIAALKDNSYDIGGMHPALLRFCFDDVNNLDREEPLLRVSLTSSCTRSMLTTLLSIPPYSSSTATATLYATCHPLLATRYLPLTISNKSSVQDLLQPDNLQPLTSKFTKFTCFQEQALMYHWAYI